MMGLESREPMLRVLIADDSVLARAVIKDMFAGSAEIAIIGEAGNGREAVAMTEDLRPDLVVMDLMMPVMTGLEAIEEIMARVPTPILVLSATVDERDVNLAFSAIKKGALDVMEKPDAALADMKVFAARLAEKIKLLSRIRVIRHHRRRPKEELAVPKREEAERNILAIGASTGGPKAVMSIVKNLPEKLPATVFIVQHIASGFAKGFAQWLDHESRIRVRIPGDGDEFREGEVLVAPNDCHMMIERGRVRLVPGTPVNCCRPSIDVLFSSIADEFGDRTVAVLLTGMGKDGAEGLRLIKKRGGHTIVQDEETSAVFGMPKAALALRAADEVLSLSAIPNVITRLFSQNGG